MCIFSQNNNKNKNEDFRTRIKVFMRIAMEKKYDRANWKFSSPPSPSPPHSSLFKWSIPKTSQFSKNGKVTRAVQTQERLFVPFLSARRPFGFCIFLYFQARTFAKTVIFNIKREGVSLFTESSSPWTPAYILSLSEKASALSILNYLNRNIAFEVSFLWQSIQRKKCARLCLLRESTQNSEPVVA